MVFTARTTVLAAESRVAPESRAAPPPLLPLLARAPLDTPLVVTGGFGEFRQGHFHAGLDFGTGGRVGKPVYAPRGGWIERVRASGVGYGRSIYLRTDDGRLLVFGHLDAFTGALGAYVAARQDSSGQYEQDLWPQPRELPVRAGERIAWSGESGAGGPHLHFEIRIGDMAYNPLRGGLPMPESSAPSLTSLTLEPLDERSWVEGGRAPRTVQLGAVPETLEALGRLRAIVGARDGVWKGVDRMVPWSVRAEWAGESIEVRFDSVSWATDMAEGDYVYDNGRVRGQKDFVLYAPAGFRPRVIVASAPETLEAGVIRIAPGDPPRVLRLVATDASGNRVVREVALRPLARAPAGLPDGFGLMDRSIGDGNHVLDYSAAEFIRRPVDFSVGSSYAALPNRRLRVVPPPKARRPALGLPYIRLAAMEDGAQDSVGALAWRFAAGGVFEPTVLVAEPLGRPASGAALEAMSEAYALHPAVHPLRKPVLYRLRLPAGVSPDRVDFYQNRGDGWEFVRARFDSAGAFFEAETRGLGRFALFRDAVAPRIGKRVAPRHARSGPYSRWALEAPIEERGSGVEARASAFLVDGRRVPSEWDGEKRVLRWRPAKPPAKGQHRYEVVATDRAGNVTRAAGTFVLD